MKFRAVIFDIYKTLLEVGPAPADAEERWRDLCAATFSKQVSLDLNEFSAACDGIIAREHGQARAIGIVNPEIFWPAIVGDVLPELTKLSPKARDEFLFQHAQLQRTVRLMAGAADVLNWLLGEKMVIGIASNSQPYTLRELDSALSAAKLNRDIFAPDLSFFSFENGFSKPNPHVFRLLTARLGILGIAPSEILMVGDRLDNDIAPARENGWQTWHLGSVSGENSGSWSALQKKLQQ